MYCTKNVNIISLEISLAETKSMKKGFCLSRPEDVSVFVDIL